MKYFFFIACAAYLIACNNADHTHVSNSTSGDSASQSTTPDSANYTSINWIDPVHQQLGKINEGSTVEVSWRFTNSGNKPLIISQVNAGCGCTVAEKPEAPIAPGKEGIITARFNSEGQGPSATKSVTVIANTKGETVHNLQFSADVVKK